MDKNNKHHHIVGRFIQFWFALLLLSLTATSSTFANEHKPSASGAIANPGSELWRNVRQRDSFLLGSTQVRGMDTSSLINTEGQAWRQLRVEKIIPYSGYVLGFTLLVLLIFRILRGQIKIDAGRSGKKILRFSLNQRTIHWVVAVLFLVLGLTGVILLLGRTLLLPYIGSSVFGAIAGFSKTIHDYIGPVFSVVLLFMLFAFIKGNWFKLKDINWFLKGGGMFGTHASAGRYNAGEKSWFWLAMIGGAVIVASGLVLDFPVFELNRQDLSLAQIIHVISAIVVLAASFAHIFMGTVAMEGALETMTTGYCDANWAIEHHDEWYEEVADSREQGQPKVESGITPDNAVKSS